VPCPYTTRKRAWFRQSCILPPGSVWASRRVARWVQCTRHTRRITLGRGARRWQGDLPRWNRRCQARGGMTDDMDPQRSHCDRTDPHPALRAGLSLQGRATVFSVKALRVKRKQFWGSKPCCV